MDWQKVTIDLFRSCHAENRDYGFEAHIVEPAIAANGVGCAIFNHGSYHLEFRFTSETIPHTELLVFPCPPQGEIRVDLPDADTVNFLWRVKPSEMQ